ncbi:hypothetical protein Ahy_B06g082349 [Arachis hypogaea]|uniref:Uncharacterized protein n=1 Tax=Arachis hypogaea TaxID=3818 RepID=A0A444YNI6_ARAHY|nr:hypothetical protein Ahy_B06g082349 [Arachis hypogaea]
MSLVLGFGLKWLLLVMRRWSLLWVFLVFRQVLLLRFVLFVSKFMVHAHNVASVLLISMPCVHQGLATEWRAPNPDTVLIMQTPLGVISTKSLLQTKKKTGSRLISSRRTKVEETRQADDNYEELGHDGNRTVANGVDKEGPVLSKLGSSSTAKLHPKNRAQSESKPTNMPPTRVVQISENETVGLPHKRLRFIPTYTNTGPSPRVDVNNNQLQQGEQDDLEVRVEKIIYRCRFLATFGVFGYLIVEINRESGDDILYYLKNFIFVPPCFAAIHVGAKVRGLTFAPTLASLCVLMAPTLAQKLEANVGANFCSPFVLFMCQR